MPRPNLNRLPDAIGVQIKAMLEMGYSIRKTAKESGISHETVIAVKRSDKYDRLMIERVKNGLAAKFYRLADKALDKIDDTKLRQSSAAQLVLVSATATDKARLIDGQPTARLEFSQKVDQELQDQITELESELEAWQSGQMANGELVGDEAKIADIVPLTETSESPINNASNDVQAQ